MVDQIARKEIEALVVTADELVNKAAASEWGLGHEDVQRLTSMAVRGSQLIDRLYGSESQYTKMFQTILNTDNFTSMHSNYYTHVAQIAGIFKAVKHDLESGMAC